MDRATKTGIDAAKTASKRVVQKPAEATRDLIVNKMVKLLQQVNRKKKKQKNRRNLYSTRKKTTNY